MAKKKRKLKKSFKIWCVLIVLFIIGLIFYNEPEEEKKVEEVKQAPVVQIDPITRHSYYVDSLFALPRKAVTVATERRRPVGYRFRRGADYRKGFPDLNDLQLATATKLGIPLIADREEAIRRKDELVYIGENPFYVIDELNYSIPYLIPRAARLLDEISRAFIDSLASRGLPLYKPFVTSVTRTERDVKRLRRVNCNASAQSCHQYGTTFDIAYNKYVPVFNPDGEEAVEYWPRELKQVMAEVLDDLRRKGTCYVRYEVHQPCFHITAR